MKQQAFIQKLLAFILLVVFAISTAPKAYFHDLVANHKDDIVNCTHLPTSAPCAHKQGFNCHFDDLVVTVPFLFQKTQISFCALLANADKQTVYLSSFSPYFFSHSTGRGPPQV
ncbi:MAG: hypothetical protein ACTHOF_11035 [Flavisolibacter sp.]